MALGSLYRPLLDLAREASVDVDTVLTGVGLTEAQLLDPSTRLLPDLGRALGQDLIARIGDPEVGLRAAERILAVEQSGHKKKRRRQDSNLRALSGQRFSRPPPSAARPLLRVSGSGNLAWHLSVARKYPRPDAIHPDVVAAAWSNRRSNFRPTTSW